MLKRIAPRCDREYTFCESNIEFTLRPITVNNQRQVVFWNINTKKSVAYSLSEFYDLYQYNLIRERKIHPGFLADTKIRNSEKVYAVARGRLDFFITHIKAFCNPAIWDYEGACYGEFDNLGDALEFLKDIDEHSPESGLFVEASLSETETKIIERYREMSNSEKRTFRDMLFSDK